MNKNLFLLEDKMCKYIASVLKNVYIDKSDEIVNKCKNTCHNTK